MHGGEGLGGRAWRAFYTNANPCPSASHRAQHHPPCLLTLFFIGPPHLTLTPSHPGRPWPHPCPCRALAVYANLAAPRVEDVRDRFTVGIADDVTFSSLPLEPAPEVLPPGTTECLFWGMGGDGTVGANKEAVKIIAGRSGMHAQVTSAYEPAGFGDCDCAPQAGPG